MPVPWLRELQERAYRAILFGDAAVLAPWILDDKIPAENRIRVYQNNARETFCKTLATSYPVIERLVGNACFRSLAQNYMLRHPSRSGNLQGFGAWFPSFLSVYYSGSRFGYLIDIARLEWACEVVRTAPQVERLDLRELAQVPRSQYAELRFSVQPAMQIVSSTYPIFEIWKANQQDLIEPIDLARGGDSVLVVRHGGDLELHRCDSALAAFSASLIDGTTLGEAAELARKMDAAFDLQNALMLLAGMGLFTGLQIYEFN